MIRTIRTSQPTAFGLMEVLIVLAIVAATMLAATQVSIQSLRVIKQNEIGDYANSVMIQALEIAKSPANVKVSADTTIANFEGSYQVFIEEGSEPVMWKVSNSITPLAANGCNEASDYYVDIRDVVANAGSPLVCIQIIVRNISGLGGSAYEITSRLIYVLDSEPVDYSIIGYRRVPFEYTPNNSLR